MPNPIVLQLVAQGGSQVTAQLNASAAAGRQLNNAMKDLVATGGASAKAAQQAGRVWASAWSPAIAAAKKFEAEEKRMATEAKARAKARADAQRASDKASAESAKAAAKARAEAAKSAAAQTKAAAKAEADSIRALDRAVADSARALARVRAKEARQAAEAAKAAARAEAESIKALDRAAADANRALNRQRAKEARETARAVAEAFRAGDAQIKARQTPVNGRGAASTFNPYIADLRRAQAAQRQLEADARRLPNALAAVRSAASSAWGAWRSGAANAGQATDTLVSKMRTLDQAMGQMQFSGIQQGANQIRNIGLGTAAVGAAGAAGYWKAATDAGSVEQVKAGFRTSLNGDETRSEALFQKVKAFDEKSPMNLLDSAKSAQTMLTMGFSDDEIPRVLNALGNMAAAGGGDGDSMNRAVIQLTQIKAKGKISAQDANALAEGGRIPVKQIFMEAFGKERTTDWMAGQERISDTEAIPAILQWIERNRGNGMENALNTLPGQIAQFNSQLFILSSTIGDDLMPVAKLGVAGVKLLVAVFNMIPAPVRKILVFAGALVAGLLILGGGLLALMAQGASTVIGLFGLATMLGLTGGAAGTTAISLGAVATALSGVLMPALMTLLGVLGMVALTAVVVGGALYVFKMYMDELKNPTASVEDKRTAEQVAADDASKGSVLAEVEDSKNADKVTRYAVLKAAQVKLAQLGEADAALPITQEMNALRGSVSEEDRLNPRLSAEGSETVRRIGALAADNKGARLSAVARPESADPHAAQMAQIQSQMQSITSMRGGTGRPAGDTGGFLIDDSPTMPSSGIPSGAGMANLGAAVSGAPQFAGLGISPGAASAFVGLTGVGASESEGGGDNTDVDVLRERAMLSRDKSEKRKIRRQLFYALRQQRDMKAMEREKKKDEREAKAEAKREEREQKKEAREAEKQRRLQLNQRNTVRRYDAQAQLAELNASYDIQIAELQAQKQTGRGADNRGILARIAGLRGEKAMRAAEIRGSGLSEENDLGRAALMAGGRAQAAKYAALARIAGQGGSGRGGRDSFVERAISGGAHLSEGGVVLPNGMEPSQDEVEAIMDRLESPRSGGSGRGGRGGRGRLSMSAIFSRLSGGESIFDISRPQRRGQVAYNQRGGGAGASSEDEGPGSREMEVQARTSVVQDEMGDYVLKIVVPDVHLPSDWKRSRKR